MQLKHPTSVFLILLTVSIQTVFTETLETTTTNSSLSHSVRGSNSETGGSGKNDWPWWRGPHRNGIAASDQNPPVSWSDTENILWSTSLPGSGHGSPIIVGDRVFLATAHYKNKIQSLICYDRNSGEKEWETEIHRGGFPNGGHRKSNLGASTPASDGGRVFINFLNAGSVYTTALNIEGQILWQTKITDFVLHQGFGSSPALYESLVLVSADHKGGGNLVALNQSNGKVVWEQSRPKLANYTSPIILKSAGRMQLVLTGTDLISSFDPLDGKKLWETEGSTTEVVTSVVTDGEFIFGSGGYPRRHVEAIHADGSGKIAWKKNISVYVPSMLVKDGYIFLVTDNGIAQCWKSKTGEEIWKGRLRGTFSASPVLVDDKIYATNENGETFIFRASTERFELIKENQLGDLVMATPTICDSRIYMRVAYLKGNQQSEKLYCIGHRGQAPNPIVNAYQ